VVGWASFTRPRAVLNQAFLWSEGVIRALGFLMDGNFSEAHAINDRGLVVGWSNNAPLGNPPHAFMWNELTGMEDLGTPQRSSLDASSDDLFSRAHAMNNSGEVVGVAGEVGGSSGNYAFIWGRSTGPNTLRELPDRRLSEAHAINDSRRVVGSATTPGDRHAFLWSESTGMEDLNVLLPPNSGWELIGAEDINDSGQILCEGFHTGPDDNARERRLCVLTPS